MFEAVVNGEVVAAVSDPEAAASWFVRCAGLAYSEVLGIAADLRAGGTYESGAFIVRTSGEQHPPFIRQNYEPDKV